MRILRAIQTAVLIFVAILTGVVCSQSLNGQTTEKPAGLVDVVRYWNEAVSTIEPEDQNFRELLESYRRNPPGRVLLTPDVRAEQKKRRLRLIESIVASHEERIRALRRLAKAEEASQ